GSRGEGHRHGRRRAVRAHRPSGRGRDGKRARAQGDRGDGLCPRRSALCSGDGMRKEVLSIPFWSPEEINAAIRPALAHLETRRVLAYPTETVYGFGGAIDRDSVAALIALKGRPGGKPFLLLVAAAEMIERLALKVPSYAAPL